MNRRRLAVMVAVLFVPILGLAAEAPKPSPALRKVEEALEKQDFDTAAKLLRAEAEKGNPEAANLYGEILFHGRGVKASIPDAVKWFQKAADAGHPGAQLNLAMILAEGAAGTPKDEEKARFLVRASAEAGFAAGQVALARQLEAAVNLQGPAPDWREPRSWLEKAAAQGSAEALAALVRYADEGLAGERNAVQGTDFCLRAAKAGSVLAMNEMGVRYQKGTGLRADNVAAIGWFALAAQYRLPAALVNLGNCYETGNGVVKDLNRTGENYAAAAKQGFAPAQLLLGELFESGKAGPANPAFAYVNYVRAAAQGLAAATARRDALKPKLSPEQLREAERLLLPPTEPPARRAGEKP